MIKKAISITIIVIVAILVIAQIWGCSEASPEIVGKLVNKAEKSPDAKVLIISFLKSNPAPSNREITQMDSKVDEFLVRDIVRKQTGDMSIKTKSEIEAEKIKYRDRERSVPSLSLGSHRFSFNDLFIYLIGLLVLIIGMIGLLSFSRVISR